MQTTLRHPVTISGLGLHGGAPATVTLRPAPAGHGVAFARVDLGAGPAAPVVPALWDRVAISPLATRLVGPDAAVSTIEHLMAALAGLGVHNALAEIDGPEVPILDGSAQPWVRAILAAGIETLAAPLDAVEVLRPVEVRDGAALARLEPWDGAAMAFAIDFPDAAIGRQERETDLRGDAFARELADSRTFCRAADVEAMRANGLALGGSVMNAVVVDGARVLTPGGLRHPDEAVRHKMLDAVGDLATAGAPLKARYLGLRDGHALTNRLLRALFARPEAWRRVRVDAALRARLPGAAAAAAGLPELPAVA